MQSVFTQVKKLNFLRSTMSDSRLDDLRVLASEKDLDDSSDSNAAVKKWASQKKTENSK